MLNISTVLKKKRKELNYTLLDIANKLDVSEATVQRWESGNIKNLRYDRITKLASVLQVSPACLMGWEDDFNASPLHQPQVYSSDEIDIIDKYRDCSLDGKNYISNQVNIAVKLYPAGESISHIEGLKSSQNNSNISFDGPPSATESEIQEALSIARNLSKVAK